MSDPSTSDVEHMVKKYDDQRQALQKLVQLRLTLTALLAVAVVGFLFALYSRAAQMYTPAQFDPHVKKEAERLKPVLQSSGNRLFRQLEPEIASLAREELDKLRPELAERAAYEWNQFTAHLQTRTKRDIAQAFLDMGDELFDVLGEEYPRLKHEVHREQFRKDLHQIVEREMDSIMVDFQKQYIQEVRKVEDTLMKFRPNRYEQFSREELSRYFLHLWVQLLDQHLQLAMEEGTHGH